MLSISARVGFKSAKVRGADDMPNCRRARRGAQAGGNATADHFDVHSLDKGASKNDKKIGVTAGWICRNNCAKIDANSSTKCENFTSNCWAINNAMIVKRVAK
jgi:hypothetical protein